MNNNRMGIAAGIVVAMIGAGVLYWYVGKGGSPSMSAAGGGVASIVDVTVPTLAGREKEGRDLFADNCAVCHGGDADGRQGKAPPLVHRIYEPGHHGDIAFQMAAERGVRQHHWPFGNMPPVPGVKRDEIEKIVAYVRALQRANGIE